MRPIVPHVAPTWVSAAIALGISALGCGEPAAPTLPSDELAYRSLADGALYLMRADGSGRRRIWSSTDDGVMCPSWSPDGSAIAFHKFIANQIVVLTIATGQEHQLTSGSDQNQCPMWSPDGTRIAFFRIAATDTQGYPLFVMGADGTNPTRLGTGTFMADRGSWSPDGRSIAASRYPDNQIVLVDAVSGATGLPLTSGSGGRGPSWSPDGRRITFNVQEGASEFIDVMDADGANVRRLTSSPFLDQYPVWTLDGRVITFHRYQNSSIPGVLLASLHMVRLDRTAVPWTVGDSAQGDLPIWRPHR